MVDSKIKGRKGEEHTSERPRCHDCSTSANDVGAAEVKNANRNKMVMKMRRCDE
jgi:hypothetical protein